MEKYWTKYYQEHKDEISQKRREKYAKNKRWRKRLKIAARDWYRKNCSRKKKSPPRFRIQATARCRVAPLGKDSVLVYSIGTLAKVLGVSGETVKVWERCGVIPKATMTDEVGRRWYSKDYVEKLWCCVKEWGRLGGVHGLKRIVWRTFV